MEKVKIDRINHLARKAKSDGLTPAETAEQKQLRDEYRAAFRRSFLQTLDQTYLVDEHGENRKLLKEKLQ